MKQLNGRSVFAAALVGASLCLAVGLAQAKVNVPSGITWTNRTIDLNGSIARPMVQKAQTLLRMKQLEQQILREVRLSTRQVRATQKRIQTTEAARDLQKEKLAGEEDRLKDGQSTPQEVLDFQVDFAVAELNNERSKLDYQKAIVDLEVAQGTLLETRLIEIVDNQILGSE